jgi:hypothetical protein
MKIYTHTIEQCESILKKYDAYYEKFPLVKLKTVRYQNKIFSNIAVYTRKLNPEKKDRYIVKTILIALVTFGLAFIFEKFCDAWATMYSGRKVRSIYLEEETAKGLLKKMDEKSLQILTGSNPDKIYPQISFKPKTVTQSSPISKELDKASLDNKKIGLVKIRKKLVKDLLAVKKREFDLELDLLRNFIDGIRIFTINESKIPNIPQIEVLSDDDVEMLITRLIGIFNFENCDNQKLKNELKSLFMKDQISFECVGLVIAKALGSNTIDEIKAASRTPLTVLPEDFENNPEFQEINALLNDEYFLYAPYQLANFLKNPPTVLEVGYLLRSIQRIANKCAASQLRVYKLELDLLQTIVDVANHDRKYQSRLYNIPEYKVWNQYSVDNFFKVILGVFNFKSIDQEKLKSNLMPFLKKDKILFKDIASVFASSQGLSNIFTMKNVPRKWIDVPEEEVLKALETLDLT